MRGKNILREERREIHDFPTNINSCLWINPWLLFEEGHLGILGHQVNLVGDGWQLSQSDAGVWQVDVSRGGGSSSNRGTFGG
jgi:hypothetical protein